MDAWTREAILSTFHEELEWIETEDDCLESAAVCFQREENYNNADITTGQNCFSEEDIAEAFQYYLEEIINGS